MIRELWSFYLLICKIASGDWRHGAIPRKKRGTFYYLCSIPDGFSRYIVNYGIQESMKEADIEIILQGRRRSTRKPWGSADDDWRVPPVEGRGSLNFLFKPKNPDEMAIFPDRRDITS